MKIASIPMIALLCLPAPAQAWLAHGFGSGMSRLDVSRYLVDKELAILDEGDRQTFAGRVDDRAQYHLVYCSLPQKLYLMRYRLDDSPAEFRKALRKYEKRYGEPEGLAGSPDSWNPENWQQIELSLIWHLNDFETILLTHGVDGSSAEFQDTSVCRQQP